MAMVSLESCYERARQFMSQGEYDRAEGVCRHILQYYPQDLGAFQLLGQINLERKQGRAARDCFRRVLEIDPENISAHWGMGIAYQDDGKIEQTISEFEQALEIKPDLADLRAQLLRLYSEHYGPAQAQLRLSRAGLGRLYVKGGLLDKAIAEFQEVLKLDPQRVDVQVSLLDAFWQSGEIGNAARVCEQVLQQLPDALKANLVLGYAHFEAGRREAAEELWRKAAACDPNNTMARALFETAPKKLPAGLITYGAATLPDFDEAAWSAAMAAAAARPPVPAAEPAPPTAIPTPAPSPVAPPPTVSEPSGISWLDSLATGEGEVREEEAELVPGIAPFDLEGIDLVGEVAEPTLEAAPAPFTLEEEATPPMFEETAAPFALEEEPAPPIFEETAAPFALAEEEPLPFAPEKVPAGAPPDQEMRPFSLEELGLSEDEIASLEEAIAATKTVEAGPGPAAVVSEGLPGEEELLGLTPFSPEEAAVPGEGVEAGLPGLAPFSLEDALAVGPAEADLGLAPFSLEEVTGPEPAPGPGAPAEGPSPEEGLALAGLGAEAELPGVAPFSLAEAAVPGGEELPEIPGLEPFSVESLGFEDMAGPAIAPTAPGGELKPFSLEDLGLEEPTSELEAVGLDRLPDSLGDEVDTGLPAFSWQEAASSKAPAFRSQLEPPPEAPPPGPSLFEKMKASRLGAGEAGEAPAGGPPAARPAEAGREELPTPAAAAVPGEAELPGLKPFSVEAFGLEEELLSEEAAAEALAPFSLEEMGLEEPELPPAKGEAVLEPFSLAELGLEETPVPTPAEGAAVAPFAPEEEIPAATAAALAAAPAEDVLRPFSLEELGLTPDEIAAMGLGPAEAAAPIAEPAAGEGVLPVTAEALPAEEEARPVVEEVAAPVVEERAAAVAEAPPALSLAELRAQVAAHPDDETMLLTLARAGVAQDAPDEAFDIYKRLIKSGKAGLEDTLVGDIQSWIEHEKDHKRLYRLHRLLGDAYMKKGWYQQAINEYAWVLSKQ